MKDEEMAEELVKRNVCGHCNRCQSHGYIGCDIYRYSKDSFLTGLKASRPQWHDLREDPNDLPDNGILVLCIDKVWTGQTFTTILRCCDGVFIDDNETPYDVIAWCEIPTYDKE